MEYPYDLESLPSGQVTEKHPKQFAPNLDRDYSKIGADTIHPDRVTGNIPWRMCRILPVEIDFDPLENFAGAWIPSMA